MEVPSLRGFINRKYATAEHWWAPQTVNLSLNRRVGSTPTRSTNKLFCEVLEYK